MQGLMDKELAYEVNGSVYFRVSKHSKYGTLASLDRSGMEASRKIGPMEQHNHHITRPHRKESYRIYIEQHLFFLLLHLLFGQDAAVSCRFRPLVPVLDQDGAGEGGGISDATEYESEKENAKDFALWKVKK